MDIQSARTGGKADVLRGEIRGVVGDVGTLFDPGGTFAKAVGRATGIVLMTKVGPAPSYPEGVHGSACLISGKASGLTIEFEHAQDRIAAALPGWQHLEQFDADGPYSTVKGFAKGQQRVFYTLSTDPPPATCRDNKPISACKVPHRRWTWTLTAAAFVQ